MKEMRYENHKAHNILKLKIQMRQIKGVKVQGMKAKEISKQKLYH